MTYWKTFYINCLVNHYLPFCHIYFCKIFISIFSLVKGALQGLWFFLWCSNMKEGWVKEAISAVLNGVLSKNLFSCKYYTIMKAKAHRFRQSKKLADFLIWHVQASEEASIFVIKSRNLCCSTRPNCFIIQGQNLLFNLCPLHHSFGPDDCIEALKIYQLQVANPDKC